MSTSPLNRLIDAELYETTWAAVTELPFDMTPDQIPAVRERFGAMALSDEVLGHEGRVDVQEVSLPGPDGLPDMPGMVLRPVDQPGPIPVLYVTNNGGKFMQPHRYFTRVELDWVVNLGVAVVSVAPPVGPEHPHPALIEGAYAGLLWLVDRAEEFGVDANAILVYGQSGGGGLAAATALMARDRGGPSLTHQLLICPMLDDREITRSSHLSGIPWSRVSNRTGWRAMLGDTAGGPDVSPYAAPSRARDLHGLPPAYLEIGTADVFHDETVEYATRLGQAGVPTELHTWSGGYHGFAELGADTVVAQAAIAARTSYLRRALRQLKQVSEI